MSKEYKAGDVYITRFHPAYGTAFGKYRAVVIITEITTKLDDNLVTVAPFTTRVKETRNQYQVVIKKGDLVKKDSVIMLWYLRTMSKSRLLEKIGSLSKKELTDVKKKAAELFI